MRIVHNLDDLAKNVKMATREAEAAFGNGDVYIEKYIVAPRHIEIQVMGDHHGNVVHLGERECSIQRRHQKLLEEAPSVALTDKQRRKLGARWSMPRKRCSIRTPARSSSSWTRRGIFISSR
jgi:acetyl-CoA carboxylase biotin carboxylase subunit